jgi:hypothetical protein
MEYIPNPHPGKLDLGGILADLELKDHRDIALASLAEHSLAYGLDEAPLSAQP